MDASLFLGSISGFCKGLGRYSLSLKIVVPLRFFYFLAYKKIKFRLLVICFFAKFVTISPSDGMKNKPQT